MDAGVFWKASNRGFDQCTERARITGAEDMEWSAGISQVIVSADFRPAAGEENPPSGAIYGFNPSNKQAPIRLSPDLPFSFHPHGIALWETKSGPRLFVINHRPEKSTIELFSWGGKSFVHEETLDDPLLITPNDIAATGPREFYVSHDHGSRSHFAQALEHYARWGRGYLSYFDGKTLRRVANGIFFANGLSIDLANQRLFVAAMLEKSVRVYDVQNRLNPVLVKALKLNAGPDNVQLAEDGTLWIGAHPKILALKKHSEHHETPAPSLVIRVKQPLKEEAYAEEIMSDTGEKISAVSVALPWKNHLFLGSIYDQKILDCPRP
ncbi:MAG: hypothetical protein EOP11_13535 [Proteobacteria bacterium]|nr:MAG: hypothetical protein EOP11_13535 [Pseudomonadota bacterium]